MKDFLSQAAKLLKEQKQYRRRVAVFLCLAVIVGYGTVMALKLYGQAMNHKMEVLDCQYKVHEHTDECYELDEEGNRISEEPVCGYADYVIHVHNDSCYDKDGELVCSLEEHELHEHTEECYVTETVLICGETAEGDEAGQGTDGAEAGAVGESPAPADSSEAAGNAADGTEGTGSAAEAGNAESTDGAADSAAGTEGAVEPQQDEIICGNEAHKHDESCYENVLNCGYAEEHVHTADCISHELICEIPEHTHGEGCYDADGNLVCGMEEHSHADECYQDSYICGKEEHSHGEGCYEAKLICGKEEHEHEVGCYAPAAGETEAPEASSVQPEATTAPESGETAGHVHTDACYQEVKTLVCGEQDELHIHDNSCYTEDCFDEEGNRIEGSRPSCGLLQLEEHTHTEYCIKTVELTPEEVEALNQGAKLHIHTEECYDEEGNLICGHDATHAHMPECYDDAGKLICGYGTESHVHEDKCYDDEGNLICGYETAKHPHTAECYDAEGNLQCGYETDTHVHDEDCYDEDGNVICGYDAAAHVHDDSCYDAEGNLLCGYETASHVHEENCYDEKGNVICGYETASHLHQDSCYDAEGNVICGYKTAVHAHKDSCYDAEGNLICGYETARHVHDDSCYDAEGHLICGYDAAVHVHEDSCYDEEGNLVCGYYGEGSTASKLYCDESVHQHDEACYGEDGSLICGKADFVVHSHSARCYNTEGKLICPLPEIEAHVHSTECYPEGTEAGAEPVCGKEEIRLHTHTDECYDENGMLACGELEILEHVHSEACEMSSQPVTKTFESERFIITAVYKPDAKIPEEAELIAEQITEESDSEHYAKRQAEYQEALGDDKATMRALLKIGFYVNGEEVEPQSPVTITIQFLDENGLAEGKPITVIHFAEEGTELLEGSNVEDGSTTFEMGSFSEIAVGYGVENVKVPLDEAIDYDTDAFHITFHIKGDVTVPIEEGVGGTESTPEEGSQQPAADTSGETEASVGSVESEEGDGQESQESGGSPENEGNSDTVADGEQPITGTTEENVFTAPVKMEVLDKDFEFKVESLDESAKEYEAAVAYGEEIGDEGEELLLQVWAYSLNYDGAEVDLSDCEVVAEITPTQALVDAAKEASVMMVDEPDEIPEDQMFGDMEQQDGFTLSVMGFSTETEIGAIETTAIKGDAIAAEIEPTVVTLGMGYFAARASGQPNPKFTVQYYANLDILNTTGSNALPVIDTSGGKLPENKKGTTASPNGNAIKNIYVDNNGNVQTTQTVTEVYKSRPFEYHKAPSFNYINALIENHNYTIKEVWVLKSGKNANSINRDDWDIYTYSKNLHFTNRSVSGTAKPGSNSGYVLIADGATLRLVYDTTNAWPDIKAAFYDYDITSGHMYKDVSNAIGNKNSGITETGSQKNGTLYYTYTKEAGINSAGNYSGSGTKLAFGNVNTGTTMGENLWNGNLLNKYNGTQGGHPTVKGSYKGCTFGLVKGLNADGSIQYAESVNAPKLFNEGTATGKTSYNQDQYSLKFIRKGDTYTLTAVNGTKATGLESFGHPSPNDSTTHTHIWTNDFWPMDSAGSYGTNGHDIKFGSYQYRENRAYAGSSTTGEPGSTASSKKTYPYSDDGKDHNSYFGMTYSVDFDLSKDYVGPLEYYFFGDDDMWVFLDGKLVCDIGGVHSSVGEYVNLWDYLHKHEEGCYDEKGNLTCKQGVTHDHNDNCYTIDSEGKKVLTCTQNKHTLTFYYTERGASGSTCWMQFTLPSVSSATPETTDEDYGHLRIEKTVTQVNNGVETAVDNNDEFTFTVHFTKDGKRLPDDYSYVKYRHNDSCYDENGNLICAYVGDTEIGHDLIIWDGGEFTLKNGEYIIVKFLPVGTKYEVTESNGAITITDNTSTESKVEYFTDIMAGSEENIEINLTDKKVATGNIPASNTTVVTYNNKFYVYSLPTTGGSGTIIYTMAGGIVLLFGAGFLYKKKFRERRG